MIPSPSPIACQKSIPIIYYILELYLWFCGCPVLDAFQGRVLSRSFQASTRHAPARITSKPAPLHNPQQLQNRSKGGPLPPPLLIQNNRTVQSELPLRLSNRLYSICTYDQSNLFPHLRSLYIPQAPAVFRQRLHAKCSNAWNCPVPGEWVLRPAIRN